MMIPRSRYGPMTVIRLGQPILGRRVSLGNPGPGSIRVTVFDENGRPFPNIDVLLVRADPTADPIVRNVGVTGSTVIDVGELPPNQTVFLTPDISMDFASSPPFHELKPGQELPAEAVFTIAKRQVERDYFTPILTFAIGGALSAAVAWGISKIR